MRGGLHCATTLTGVAGHQPALLRIEALVPGDDPLVKSPFAQGLALRLFGRRGLPERDDISHCRSFTNLAQTHPFEP